MWRKPRPILLHLIVLLSVFRAQMAESNDDKKNTDPSHIDPLKRDLDKLYDGMSVLVSDSIAFMDSTGNRLFQPRSSSKRPLDPEVNMLACELVTSKGLPCERHWVETADHYILEMQRIPPLDAGASKSAGRLPVFLQHGLLCSATNWLTNLRNQSFAYILSDAGYDVWMGNIRGNRYSRNHSQILPSDPRFWDFSWQDMATYDLPAMIDYVLNTTGAPKLNYVGHSQGTLIGFTGFMDPVLAGKIERFYALAPVAYLSHVVGPLRFFSFLAGGIKDLIGLIDIHEFLPNNWLIKSLGESVCRDHYGREICSNVLFLIAGYDTGTSTKNMVHFAQLVTSGVLQKYDYGFFGNWERYDQLHPPEYDLNQFNVSTVFFMGSGDILADPTDIETLLERLNPNVIRSVVRIDHYSHLDFIWAMDSPTFVYEPIIQFMQGL